VVTRLVTDGQAANPPPARGRRRGGARRSPAGRLLARLAIHRDEVLRSLDDTRVPFDNNQAERDLRMVKLQQKVSGCWRTLAGAAAFLAVRSYVATARKQRMNPLAVLRRLFEGAPWLQQRPGRSGRRPRSALPAGALSSSGSHGSGTILAGHAIAGDAPVTGQPDRGARAGRPTCRRRLRPRGPEEGSRRWQQSPRSPPPGRAASITATTC
jgi:Transposase IS66 family